MTNSSNTRLRDRYEPLETIGRGGQGEVLKARDHFHDRLVAIKVREAPTAADLETFLQEARVLLNLEPHPGFPVVRDDFFEDDRYYLVMDWVEGIDLATLLQQRGDPGLPYAIVLRYVEQVASTLDHLHAQDPPVVHQDVKPANLILTPKQKVVLVDFGIAGSRTGPIMGTPHFAAPEIVAGETPTAATDIFGLAATTYALLTGSPPRGDARTWEDVPRESVGAVEYALGRGLAVDPSRRPGSAEELVERLRARLDNAAAGAGVDVRETSSTVGLSQERPKHARRIAPVAIFAIAALAIALWWFVLRSPDPGLAAVPVNSVGRIDLETGVITDAIGVGRTPTTVVAADGSIWVGNLSSRTITRIEARSGRTLDTIATGGAPTDMSVGPDAIWVTNQLDGSIVGIDRSSGEISTTLKLPVGAKSIAADDEAIWVTNAFDRTLTRIDPRSHAVDSSLRLPGVPADVAIGFGSVWVSEVQTKRLLRIDPDAPKEVVSIALRAGADQIAIDDEAVWVSSPSSNQVLRVDPEARTSTAIDVGNAPTGIDVAGGNVWVTNYLDGTLSRIQANESRVVETIHVGNSPEGVVASDGYLWVTVHAR